MKKTSIKIDVGMVDDLHVNKLRKLIKDFPLNHFEIEVVRIGKHTNVYYFENLGTEDMEHDDGDARIEFNLIFGDIQKLIEKIPASA